jgi:hypothetical protein
MSKPGVDPSSGTSSEDDLRPAERHPACRRREARPGSGTERENLDGDAKGKGTSGSNREAESTDAPGRGGLLRSSDEAGVMLVERRERAIAIGAVNRRREEPEVQWKAAAFARWHEPDDARVSSPDVCPVKASMFSRVQTCRGKSQAPRSWDSRVAGNQDSGAYRRGLSSGRLRVIGP